MLVFGERGKPEYPGENLWLAHDGIILSHKSFGRDQQETFFTFAPLAKWYVNVSFLERLILKGSYH